MSEPKFTEGPWNNVKKQDYYNLGVTEHYYDVYHILNTKGEIIAKLTAEGMGKDKNIKANAALITTSPKLYKKLHDILEQQCGECCSTVDVGDIRGKTPCEKGETCPHGMDDVKTLLSEARGEE